MKVNAIVENKLDSKLSECLGVKNTYTELKPDSKKVVAQTSQTQVEALQM